MKNRVKLRVTGKNINNFVKRIIRDNYNIYNLDIINYKSCYIVLDYNDYLSLVKRKSIYEYEVICYYGYKSLLLYFNKNKYLYGCLIVGLIILMVISNIIFKIEVVHENKEIRDFVIKELDKYGIRELVFKKNYDELELIEEDILNNNKDMLDWIEINVIGTKYLVKVEERLISKDNLNDRITDIVASKSGIINRVIASSGVIVKKTHDYVNKGDVIISSEIVLPNGEIILTKAMGVAYAEVWYTVNINYPYVYREEKLTGKSKDVIVINFLNKRLSLFDFNKYHTFRYSISDRVDDFFNFLSIKKERQYELNVIDEVYTNDEIVDKALEVGIKKMNSVLDLEEEILDYRILHVDYLDNGVNIVIFFKVIEDISFVLVK